MKHLVFILIFAFILPSAGQANVGGSFLEVAQAQVKKSKKRSVRTKRKARKTRSNRKRARRSKSQAAQIRKLNSIEAMIASDNNQGALKELFKIRRSFRFRSHRSKIYYLMGLAFYNLNFYQTAAFQFGMAVTGSRGRNLVESINKLEHISTNILHSSAMLNYALSKVELSTFPKEYQNKLRVVISEVYLTNKQYDSVIKILSKVDRNSEEYLRAKYIQSLAYAEINKPKQAYKGFSELANIRNNHATTDVIRVNATLGMARAAYQAKDWKEAIRKYKMIPRDTIQWHDSIFELSWAQMRAAQFRSALSNFHSLHSPYYKEMYQPESLILRAIIYLYICKYDELDKVLKVFKNTYFPIKEKLVSYTAGSKNPKEVFDDLVSVQRQYEEGVEIEHIGSKLPVVGALSILRDPKIKNYLKYAQMLQAEKVVLQNASWASSAMQRYVSNMLNKRLENTKKAAGRSIINTLGLMRSHLIELSDQQYDFIRYEMLGAQKSKANKTTDEDKKSKQRIDAKINRGFYVRNGYEYWPFGGEYWLDEIGNYYFLGVSNCE